MGIFKPTLPRVQRGHPLAQGLVGAWEFTEGSGLTAYDSSGFGNHGIVTNGPTWTGGRAGSALSFNGTTQYVDVSSFNKTFTSATFIAWVNRTGSGSNAGIIFSRGTNVSGMQIFDTGTLLAYTWNDASNTYDWSSNLTIPLNQWALIAVAVEPTQAKAYMGSSSGLAVAVNTVSHTSSVLDSLKIARDSYSTRYFPGLIDNACIYNRALSAAEIALMYAQTGP